VLVVIDGLTPAMLEATDTPALQFLLEHGSYRRAASVFPSVTPVCLASIAPARTRTCTGSRTSSGGTARSSG
jgi:predicted AlkP superfamily phosphohydrolase/phosphomutase